MPSDAGDRVNLCFVAYLGDYPSWSRIWYNRCTYEKIKLYKVGSKLHKITLPPKKNGQQFNTKHEKFMAFMFAPFFTHTSQAFIRQKLSSLQTFARTATMQVFLGLFETRVRKSNRFSSFPHSNVNFRSTFFRI